MRLILLTAIAMTDIPLSGKAVYQSRAVSKNFGLLCGVFLAKRRMSSASAVNTTRRRWRLWTRVDLFAARLA